MSEDKSRKQRSSLVNKTKLAVMVFVVALAANYVLAQPESQTEKLSPDQIYAELAKEFSKAQREFYGLVRKAKTTEERSKIYSKDPRRAYVKKFLALADEHRKTAAARKALIWVCQNGRGAGPDSNAIMKKAIDQLLEDHIADKDLASALGSLAYVYGVDTESVFRRVMEKSPHRNVQGMACYYLARVMRRRGQLTKPREEEAIALLERVKKEFGELRHYRGNLAKAAEGDLFELRNLAIGKTAPEIVGEDVDGVEFKLSDYRGKVVVIDFWGNW